MRRPTVILLLFVLGLGLGWLWRRQSTQASPTAAGVQATPGSERTTVEPGAGRSNPERFAPIRSRAADEHHRLDRAQADRLRTQILAALAARAAPAPANTAPPAADRAQEAPRPPGNLANRGGFRDELVQQLNHEFIPLAQECIELAQKDAPTLSGMLAIGLETVADQELGAVVDQAELTAQNQIQNAALLECIRETALSLHLPPPPGSGREKFELTLRVDAAKP